jgi:hypothetical protein
MKAETKAKTSCKLNETRPCLDCANETETWIYSYLDNRERLEQQGQSRALLTQPQTPKARRGQENLA